MSRTSRFAYGRGLRGAALVVALTLVLAGCDWAQNWFGPDRRNYNPSEAALTASSVANLGVSWSKTCACGAPLVVAGTVYVMDGPTLRTFRADTGAAGWFTTLGANHTLVAVANGLVYLRTTQEAPASDQLIARDASNGAARFATTPRRFTTDPVDIANVLIDGSLAYVTATPAGGSTHLYAIDTAGRLVWSKTPGGVGGELVADPGKTIYVSTTISPLPDIESSDRAIPLLTGYRASDGALVSGVRPQVCCESTSIVAFDRGFVYTYASFAFGGQGQGLTPVDPATGRVPWNEYARPVAWTPNAIVAEFDAQWTAVDPVSGETVWSFLDPSGDGFGAAVGELFLRSVGDTIEARRLSDGTVVDTFVPVAGETIARLIPSNGHIFVTTNTGKLVAVKPAS